MGQCLMTNQSMEMATIHLEPWQHSRVTPCSVWLATPPVSVEMAQEQWGSSLPHLALVSVSEQLLNIPEKTKMI